MNDSIVPKAIGFLTNNYIIIFYRERKREREREGGRERERRIREGNFYSQSRKQKVEKFLEFSFTGICTLILCALEFVYFHHRISIPRGNGKFI